MQMASSVQLCCLSEGWPQWIDWLLPTFSHDAHGPHAARRRAPIVRWSTPPIDWRCSCIVNDDLRRRQFIARLHCHASRDGGHSLSGRARSRASATDGSTLLARLLVTSSTHDWPDPPRLAPTRLESTCYQSHDNRIWSVQIASVSDR